MKFESTSICQVIFVPFDYVNYIESALIKSSWVWVKLHRNDCIQTTNTQQFTH